MGCADLGAGVGSVHRQRQQLGLSNCQRLARLCARSSTAREQRDRLESRPSRGGPRPGHAHEDGVGVRAVESSSAGGTGSCRVQRWQELGGTDDYRCPRPWLLDPRRGRGISPRSDYAPRPDSQDLPGPDRSHNFQGLRLGVPAQAVGGHGAHTNRLERIAAPPLSARPSRYRATPRQGRTPPPGDRLRRTPSAQLR